MLNEERIRLMTKMASYETREGKEHMPIKQYYRRDYISYEMMKIANRYFTSVAIIGCGDYTIRAKGGIVFYIKW